MHNTTEKKLRVLLAENSPGEAAASLRALYPESESRLDLSIVSKVSEVFSRITLMDPEIVLLDLSLAGPDPLDTVRKLHRSAPSVPLVVFSDSADKGTAAACLHEGAMDFLLKGLMDPRTLDRVLRAALERNTLDGLTNLLRDPLTGLYIRDGFITLASRSIEQARRHSGTLVLFCAMLENLKSLRNEFGQGAVDHTLREVADVISGSFRRTDIVARLGEAQFAALAFDAKDPSASVLRKRLDSRLAALNQERNTCGPVELRISVGFSSAQDVLSFPDFLDAVETQLRHAPIVASEKSPSGAGVERV